MDPLMSAIGIGPFFTLLSGLVGVLGSAGVFLIRTRIRPWRLKREARDASKAAAKLETSPDQVSRIDQMKEK